ncbi:MAG: hypothetical protein LUH21_26375 [Clostridiales bacterium]|nr:hypothetical protein [Clostridiales bacterium]
MREELKEQLRTIIGSLGRAEAILDSFVRKKDEESLGTLYEDMQNAAIEVGNTIELVEGGETETVKLLEEYCDLIWQYMVEADRTEKFRIGRLMAGKRGEIIKSIETEFKGEIEAVFLLCRAAGWKTLERFMSIVEDQANYCLIMAPYVKCTPDGRETRIIETELLPESVKAEAFEDYDMKEEKPDIVFVDGPYGESGGSDGADAYGCSWTAPGYDFMTIRESAGLLIYAPYYEEEMTEPGEEGRNEALAETCAKDCMSPQVQYSDIILVPSEEVGEAYIKALKQMDGGQDYIKKIYAVDSISGKQLLKKGTPAVNGGEKGQKGLLV